MKSVYISLFVFIFPLCSLSQDFIRAAALEQQIDEHGNVINNDIDQNGLKQGDWIFVDINGNRIAKKVYDNNNCQATYVVIQNKWINTRDLSSETKYNSGAIAELKANGITLNKDRQVLIIFNESGEFLSGAVIGNWSKNEESKVISVLKSYFSKKNIKSSSKTYILF
ncbi:MAG: hypothetical protein R2780_01510 [Crocinitomicaceae bacterium]|nr:hypothetical protein [Crocinitomicaceae bacterium]